MVSDDNCLGAYVLIGGGRGSIICKITILATGGAGGESPEDDKPGVATGDGMAIAFPSGAVLEDMEFIQFHPTVLLAPSAPQFLLSEAMRGEGAIIRNIHKEPFMKSYHPDAELAPRDVVTRAILSQMVRTMANHVYLDLTHLNNNFVKNRFRGFMQRVCRCRGHNKRTHPGFSGSPLYYGRGKDRQ